MDDHRRRWPTVGPTAPSHRHRPGRHHAAPAVYPRGAGRRRALPNGVRGRLGAGGSFGGGSHRRPPLHARSPRGVHGSRRPAGSSGSGHRAGYLPAGDRRHPGRAPDPHRTLSSAGVHLSSLPRGGASHRGGHHRRPGPGVGGRHRTPVRSDRSLYSWRLHLSSGGPVDHQLPPPPLQPAAAGGVVLRSGLARPQCRRPRQGYRFLSFGDAMVVARAGTKGTPMQPVGGLGDGGAGQ